ncbi:MAG: endolytic transglycosylase MltG [Clostridia bacterium]|nr:endolytic transglycosylase MltG [Clostridia bacterium]
MQNDSNSKGDVVMDDASQQNTEITADTELDNAMSKRAEQVKNFVLNVDVDEIPDINGDEPLEEKIIISAAAVKPETADATVKNAPKRAANKALRRVLYASFVILLSALIAGGGILYFFEVSGISGTSEVVAINIPSGAYTQQIAAILKDNGLINSTLIFRLYSKLTKADGKWQVGTFMLSSNMGYAGIAEELQTATPRANVDVTIPEGYTVPEIAQLLEEKGVCTATDFTNAVVNGSYDYDFVKAIPTASDGEEHAGRIYRLEGYLFPDTYNFYKDSTGTMVVERMLANFDSKLTPELRQQIKNKGWTIDQAVIFASVVQGEAGMPEDMLGVSRVLTNRMQPNSGYAKLECDSTRDYVKAILPGISGTDATSSAYDTYVRSGLPVGAINNPGMQAIKAALNPSNDPKHADCYFFATDYDTGITYFSKTFSQHVATCIKYKIGMYG